jgi:ketosteroid isomerase-like protein
MSENSEFVRNAYSVLAAGDLDAFRDLLADDVVWHARGWGHHAGDYTGKEAVLSLIRSFEENTEGTSRTEVETFLEDGNRVVTVMTTSQEAPRRFEGKHVDIWDLRDGKLVEYWGIQADQEAGAKAFS